MVLFLVYNGVGVVCVYLFSSFSNVRVFGNKYTIPSGKYGWSLVRLIYLGSYGWK